MLIGLKLTIGVFGDNPVQAALDDIIGSTPNGFVAIVIVVLTGAIANIVRELVVSPWPLRRRQGGRRNERLRKPRLLAPL